MPELPEVETVCRGLRPVMEGRRIERLTLRRPDLRFPIPKDFAARVGGKIISRIERRAKYILMHLDTGDVVIAHLGMSGRMKTVRGIPNEIEAHDHVEFAMQGGTTVTFNDPRRFGMLLLETAAKLAQHKLLRDLGPEPLGAAFDGAYLAAQLKGKRTPIKAALLDQHIVAGLGNIYVSEALFHAGISPKRSAASIGAARAARLADAVKMVLARAIEAGGSSLRDYVQPSGELGYFQHQWAVYGRAGEACPGCDCTLSRTGGIRQMVQSNRSTFYCPRRQR
ncbi:MAG: bifunctional DNA-formamidopyrimidine glycosylase/DNA-(apurinic or apyrimidinic site) lyase [Alphaproteobacteria bacterium]